MPQHILHLDHSRKTEYTIGFLCLLVYSGALFFPLIDKDAAHHANIALYMVEHNNYINLVDRGQDYLDKPHLLFWVSALSFKIFGVTSFAHRLPALLFALLSVFSVYKLCKHLAGSTTAKLSAIILATAQAFVLSVNDARMETPLTAGIMLGLWQFIVYIDKKRFVNLLLAAVGAGVAFSTKGWIGPIVMFISVFFYLLTTKRWQVLIRWHTWLFIPLFFIFVSPVLYAYYVQFDLHPEKFIRGTTGHSGLRFILWDQLFERTQGFDQGQSGRNSDYFFLYHTFLWAFFPWTLFACAAIAFWFRRIIIKKNRTSPFAFAFLSFCIILILISFSKFKMPHYIIMLLPLAAMYTGYYLRVVALQTRRMRFHVVSQIVIAALIILITACLNFYFFQPLNAFVWIAGLAMIAGMVYLLFRRFAIPGLKAVVLAASSSLLLNFFLNHNFFPNLMKYQGGNELVRQMKTRNINIPDSSIMLVEIHSHSFDFFRQHNHPTIEVGDLKPRYDSIRNKYFLANPFLINKIEKEGFTVTRLISVPDYSVATVKFNFLNPATRGRTLDSLNLVTIRKE